MRIPHDCYANLVAALSHDIRASVVRIFTLRTGCEDCRATVMRRSCDVHANVANLSPRNFGEFTMQNFRDTRTNVVRVLHNGRTTVLRQHAKNSRLPGETLARMSRYCRTN